MPILQGIDTGRATASEIASLMFNQAQTRRDIVRDFSRNMNDLSGHLRYGEYQKELKKRQEEAQKQQEFANQVQRENLDLQKEEVRLRGEDLKLRGQDLALRGQDYIQQRQLNNLRMQDLQASIDERNLQNKLINQSLEEEARFYAGLEQNPQTPQTPQNPQESNLQSPQPNLQNLQSTTQTQESAEPLKPNSVKSAGLSSFLKERNAPLVSTEKVNAERGQSTQGAQNYSASASNAGVGNLQNTTTTQEPKKFRNTGNLYLDTKPYLTYGDRLYAAKMGIDLAKVNANLQVKKVDVGKTTDKINDNLTALKSTTNLIKDTEQNAGFYEGVRRKLNQATGGIIPNTDTGARYAARDMSNTKNLAQSDAQGKATNQDKLDAKQIYSTRYQSTKDQVNTLAGAMETTLYNLWGNMKSLRDKGAPIPQETQNLYNAYFDMYAYLKEVQDRGGEINFKRWNSMLNYVDKNGGAGFDYGEWAKIRGNRQK